MREESAQLAEDQDICHMEMRKVFLSKRAPIEGKLAGPKKPVVRRTLDEARAACQARGMDLPTGEQWEKAARGPLGKLYGTKSGQLSRDEACYNTDGPYDVMSFPPNAYGLYDMSGNVQEWTLDSVGDVYKHTVGGSWNSYSIHTLLANDRMGGGRRPEFRDDDLGFRCVAAPQKTQKR